MEICQSCSKKIESWERVSFGVIGGVTRSWVMCELCADVLQDMVLGYMGEIPPEQGSPESLGEYGIFADGTFVDGDGRFITAPPEEQSCVTCRGYSPLLFECTKRTKSGGESCRRHGFAWWEPKEPEQEGRCDTCFFITPGVFMSCAHWNECRETPPDGSHWKPREPEPNGTAREDYTAWFDEELPFADEPCPGYYGESRDRELPVAEEPKDYTLTADEESLMFDAVNWVHDQTVDGQENYTGWVLVYNLTPWKSQEIALGKNVTIRSHDEP